MDLSKQSRNRLYQRLARVGLVLAVWCSLCTVWAIWEYNGYGKALVAANADLSTAVTYYDWNRDQMPVQGVRFVKTATACDAQQGWHLVKGLAQWQGSVAGCNVNGKVHAGACQHGKGVAVTKVDAVNVDNWRAGHFCLNRLVVDKTHPDTRTHVADGGKCAAGLNQCSACSCWKGACPVTSLSVGKTAGAGQALCQAGDAGVGGYKGWCAHKAGANHLVGVQVSLYGLSCKEQRRHHAQPKNGGYVLLNALERGCGAEGTDAAHTVQADEQLLKSFQADNAAVLATALKLPGYSASVAAGAGKALLVGRYRVGTKCSAACRGFRFGDHAKVAAAYARVWARVRQASIVVGCLSLVSLMVLVWVTLHKKYQATQNDYMMVMSTSLVTLVVFVVYLGLVVSDLRDLNRSRHHAVTAHHAKCIADAGWAKVLTDYVNRTALASLHHWVRWLMGFSATMLLVGVVVEVRVLRALSAKRQQAEGGEEWELFIT